MSFPANKQPTGNWLQKALQYPSYIFLFTVYPVVFMYSHNKTEIQGWMIIRPLIISLLLMALVSLFARLGFRSSSKGSFFTLVFLVLFFSYGQIYHLQETAPAWIEPIIRHRYLILLPLAVLVGAGWLISKKDLTGLTLPLNIITGVLLALPLVNILSYESRKIQNKIAMVDLKSSDVPSLNLTIPANAPDIYYIILDTYTRADVLQNRFGWDNSAFINDLTKEGAYVANCSRSNYAQTLLSLNSSLNISWIDNIQPEIDSAQELSQSLNNSIVYQTLRENGYQLIAFDSGFIPTNIVNSDRYLSPKNELPLARLTRGFQAFESMFYDSTAIKLILDNQNSLPPAIQQFIKSPYSEVRETIFYQLNQVANLQNGSSPKIVHLHLLAPHPPASFDSEGRPVDGVKYFTLNPDVTKKREFARNAYIEEVQYLNKRILDILRSIKNTSTRPFVFIVQGDHGTYGFGTGDQFDRIKILNVYYFSDGDYSSLYPGITPINTFRIVMNKYFNARLPMMPDTTYYSAYDARFDFYEIGENYPPCMN